MTSRLPMVGIRASNGPFDRTGLASFLEFVFRTGLGSALALVPRVFGTRYSSLFTPHSSRFRWSRAAAPTGNAPHARFRTGAWTLLALSMTSAGGLAEESAARPVTFAKEVSRILQKRCQECHRPGMPGPFSLLSYEDAVDWSGMINEVVSTDRMPPWHADPHYSAFLNDRRLSAADKATLLAWIEQGTPLGDEKDLPEPIAFAEGWQIGEPDVVFRLPHDVTIQAEGTVPYMYFQTPTNFTEDVYIQAAEARPGNRAVVHHIIVTYLDPANEGKRTSNLGDGGVCGTAPGDMPTILRPGHTIRIPKGATLVWQMHYTPTGKEEIDRSEVGLVFYKHKTPPRYFVRTSGAFKTDLRLPPGEPNYQTESQYTFDRDVLITGFMPHMHVRGKDFLYRLVAPDGTSRILLSVPRYDFNWQTIYRLAEPVAVEKGSVLKCVAHHDNSTANPANPDPTEEVRWGDQTWEEMMIGWFDYAVPIDDPAGLSQQRF